MSNKSKIIIGCMSWGSWGKKLSIEEQAEMIQFCTENGNSTFDLADIYGDYTSESEFGEALNKSGVKRDQTKLISKCGIQLVNENRNTKTKHYNYSKEYIVQCVEKSLRHLNTDYLDTLLLHRPSPLMEANEIA
ncbi:MAG: aldo/keto reductase, partial [Bacteroidia bacterium]|nr:aldo/keto reductase [Bacteroidia bacterium]